MKQFARDVGERDGLNVGWRVGEDDGPVDGEVDGDAVGAGVSHVPSALHRPLQQSRMPCSHCLPGGHGRHSPSSAPRYWPGSHGMHELSPIFKFCRTGCSVPGGHGSSALAARAFCQHQLA